MKNIKKVTASNVFINASLMYVLANGVGQGVILLSNIFFTRFMKQSDYGLYSNYYSYVSILVPFVGMNLYCGLANAYIDYKKDIYKFRSSVLLLSIAGLIITTITMLLIKLTIGLSLSGVCILIAIMHAYGFFLINYLIQSFNMENNYISKSVLFVVPNILQIAFAIVAVVISNTFFSRALGSSFGILICGLFSAVLILRKEKPIINNEYWGYVLRISLPAIIGSVSAMIMQQCDKVMITSFIGAEETAVYALTYNIGYILYAVQQATNGVWQVWLYNTLDQKKYDKIGEVQKWYMFVMLFLATGIFMVSPEIVKILSPSPYWHFDYIIPFVLGSYLMLMYSLHMTVTEYMKRTGINSLIVSAAAVFNILMNYYLIPRFSGLGAAYTSVLSYLFIFLVSGIFMAINYKYYFEIKYFFGNFCIVVLMGITFYYVKENVLIRYLLYSFFLVVEGIYILMKRKDLLFLLKIEK